MFTICDKREAILNHQGHLLIEGGPGSGKTTIALLKAKRIIDSRLLLRNQKILFLSFARATISRIEEQAKDLINQEHKKQIEINTYHGFSWSIIQSYGYLLNKHKIFELITPPDLLALTAHLKDKERDFYKLNLLQDSGKISFDLFSKTVFKLISESKKIASIISTAYPYIIVDEFQDTDESEWEIIKLLGQSSKIIALADMDQRIYDFRGASVTRIPSFKKHFDALTIDFGKENNRSTDTDITQFGDDILTGDNIGSSYNFVKIIKYPYYADNRLNLKMALLKSINRLKKLEIKNWSIAILVYSKALTLTLSTYLDSFKIPHEVLIDPSGPSLSASIIAALMEPRTENQSDVRKLIANLINHLRGRKTKISQEDLKLITALERFQENGKIIGKNRISLKEEITEIIAKRSRIELTGDPFIDWVQIRDLFMKSSHDALKNVYEDAKFLKLLKKGAILSEKLSDTWRNNGTYFDAGKIISEALVQEHFSMSSRIFQGIYVMNIHKCKGKEFDEVLIWEEPYKQIITDMSDELRVQQSRLLIRVAATRARIMTTFLTPASSPCLLL